MWVGSGDKSLLADNRKKCRGLVKSGAQVVTKTPVSLLIPHLGPFRPKTPGLQTVRGPNLNNRPSGDSRVDKRQSKDRALWGSSLYSG